MQLYFLALGTIIGAAYTTFIDIKKIKSLKKEINELRTKHEPWKELEHIDN